MLSRIASVIEIQNIQLQLQLQIKFFKYNYKHNYSVFKKINYNYNYNHTEIVINYSITCVIDPNPDFISFKTFLINKDTCICEAQSMKLSIL